MHQKKTEHLLHYLYMKIILKNGVWEIKKTLKIYDSLPFDWLTGATLVTWLDCGWFVDAKVL